MKAPRIDPRECARIGLTQSAPLCWEMEIPGIRLVLSLEWYFPHADNDGEAFGYCVTWGPHDARDLVQAYTQNRAHALALLVAVIEDDSSRALRDYDPARPFVVVAKDPSVYVLHGRYPTEYAATRARDRILGKNSRGYVAQLPVLGVTK